MKHYAYHNMSRRTQLTTKFVFQTTSQISENFIFIYLGLSLFTDDKLDYKPLFILVTVAGICAARWAAVFPLSKLINAITRYRQRRRGAELVEEIPYAHQCMIYWAGLRGAVGVALAAGLTGNNGDTLRATILVVVVLTVIIFGGTTARMLEILGIRTGVVEEIDSDDEFDIEVVNGGTYTRNKGQGFGNVPRSGQNGLSLNDVNGSDGTYSSSTSRRSPQIRPNGALRRQSSQPRARDGADQNLLSPADSGSTDEDDIDLDLPPSARRSPNRVVSPSAAERSGTSSPYPTSGIRPVETGSSRVSMATGAVKHLFNEISHDPANAFKQIDDGFLKPHLLLDQGKGPGPSNV
jgi:sodium/hydrogen exchanger-like protein 6/7